MANFYYNYSESPAAFWLKERKARYRVPGFAKKSLKIAHKALICSAFIFSCSHPTPQGLANAELGATPQPPAATPQSALQRFELTAPEGSAARQALQDVFHILRAQALEERGNLEEAEKAWLKGLKLASGGVGEIAFKGWGKSFCHGVPGHPVASDVMQRLVSAEISSGTAIPYLKEKNLHSPDQIVEALGKLVPGCVEKPVVLDSGEHALIPPAPGILPAGDASLSHTGSTWCKASQEAKVTDAQRLSWAAWQQSLPPNQSIWWAGRMAECNEDFEQAITLYRQVGPKLLEQEGSIALGMEAYQRTVQIYRSMGQREAAAKAFLDLVKAWESPNVTARALGISKKEERIKRVDDTLWAGRAAATVADYETAKRLAQDSLNLVNTFYQDAGRASATDRTKLASFKAEAYHLLAFRVAVEQHDYDSAVALNLTALQIADLPQEWRERLLWYAGLYDFVSGRYLEAKRRWDSLLAETQDAGQKPKLYFWLSRLHLAQNQPAESSFYAKALVNDYPLSFYSVVALDLIGIPTPQSWKDTFQPDKDLRQAFYQVDPKVLDAVRAKMPQLLLRAEVLTNARLTDLARLTIRDLESGLEKNYKRDLPLGAKMYVARLYFASGNLSRSIRKSADFVGDGERFWPQYPEHIFAFFPQPYSDLYEKSAAATGLEVATLLGVTRQESSFDQNIRSPAQAVGLMQLLPITAKRYSTDTAGGSLSSISEKLTNPSFNIKAGAGYLRFLRNRYKNSDPAMYAAYNAGEYAVDKWLEKRPSPDVLIWTEFIPYGETQGYVKSVWRNVAVYEYLQQRFKPLLDGKQDNVSLLEGQEFFGEGAESLLSSAGH